MPKGMHRWRLLTAHHHQRLSGVGDEVFHDLAQEVHDRRCTEARHVRGALRGPSLPAGSKRSLSAASSVMPNGVIREEGSGSRKWARDPVSDHPLSTAYTRAGSPAPGRALGTGRGRRRAAPRPGRRVGVEAQQHSCALE